MDECNRSGKAGMRDMGQMTIQEIQKKMDDSLFSEIAWMSSQIMMRETLRKEIYDRRASQGVGAVRALEGSAV